MPEIERIDLTEDSPQGSPRAIKQEGAAADGANGGAGGPASGEFDGPTAETITNFLLEMASSGIPMDLTVDGAWSALEEYKAWAPTIKDLYTTTVTEALCLVKQAQAAEQERGAGASNAAGKEEADDNAARIAHLERKLDQAHKVNMEKEAELRVIGNLVGRAFAARPASESYAYADGGVSSTGASRGAAVKAATNDGADGKKSADSTGAAYSGADGKNPADSFADSMLAASMGGVESVEELRFANLKRCALREYLAIEKDGSDVGKKKLVQLIRDNCVKKISDQEDQKCYTEMLDRPEIRDALETYVAAFLGMRDNTVPSNIPPPPATEEDMDDASTESDEEQKEAPAGRATSTCGNCKKKGHTVKKCPIKCTYCRMEKGHGPRQCEKKQADLAVQREAKKQKTND